MNPESVTPKKFEKHTVIYNDGHFSVAYGEDQDGKQRLAMRWNGQGNHVGYPSQGGNPLWFQLPDYGMWTAELLKMIESIKHHEQTIKDLKNKI
jgi:hypothetical protein